MGDEKLMMQRRIDNLLKHIDCLYGELRDYEQQTAKLKAELEAVKRERDAYRKACDPEYIVMLERKAMTLDALEEILKCGLCAENGGAEDEQG